MWCTQRLQGTSWPYIRECVVRHVMLLTLHQLSKVKYSFSCEPAALSPIMHLFAIYQRRMLSQTYTDDASWGVRCQNVMVLIFFVLLMVIIIII